MVVINLQKLPTSPNPKKAHVARRRLPSNWNRQKLYERNGKYQKNVTLAVLKKLANALDVSGDELLK
jgi:hypothetical protein